MFVWVVEWFQGKGLRNGAKVASGGGSVCGRSDDDDVCACVCVRERGLMCV